MTVREQYPHDYPIVKMYTYGISGKIIFVDRVTWLENETVYVVNRDGTLGFENSTAQYYHDKERNEFIENAIEFQYSNNELHYISVSPLSDCDINSRDLELFHTHYVNGNFSTMRFDD